MVLEQMVPILCLLVLPLLLEEAVVDQILAVLELLAVVLEAVEQEVERFHLEVAVQLDKEKLAVLELVLVFTVVVVVVDLVL
jgi:hypothetical protein